LAFEIDGRDWRLAGGGRHVFILLGQPNRKTGDVKGEGSAFNNLGLVCVAQGKYSNALINFEIGLELRKKIGVPTRWTLDPWSCD
jgi:hypothetical protein